MAAQARRADSFEVRPDWPACQEVDGCTGRRLEGGRACLAHADPDEQTEALALITAGEPVTAAAGVRFTEALLARLLAALPRTDDGRLILRDADFRLAALGPVALRRACFQGSARFDGANFRGAAVFSRAEFRGFARFSGASFQAGAAFNRASFHAGVWFDNAQVHGDAVFEQASLQGSLELGPMAVGGTLDLDRTTFDQPLHLEAAAWRLSCRRSRFRAGGHLRVAWAEISLADAEIPAPLIVARQPVDPLLARRVPWLAGASREAPDRFVEPIPSLVSLQRADVAGLVLADVDLRECRFAGAHHLDQLQFATAAWFYQAPAWYGRGRQVLAEECDWRQAQGGRAARRWRHTTSPLFRPRLLGEACRLHRSEVATLYRQLRKGREDAKNEPGAASFYYGECELRRHALATPAAERAILWLYWLTSGYGLRASRALAWLTAILAAATMLIATIGLPPPPSQASPTANATNTPQQQSSQPGATPPPGVNVERPLPDRLGTAALIALEGAVFRSSDQALTYRGRLVQILLRILGPVLLGLALLSIRGRVKR